MAGNIIFVPRTEFEEMIGKDEFLEYANVFGNYYGTARRFLREAEEEGKTCFLDIDVQGAAQIKGKIPEAASIFILPPIGRNWKSGCVPAVWMPKR